MNQNQSTDSQQTDNDLQKAIDNITSNTNTDPVFSDPVAAPSSVPEGDTGELGEPIGPFPEPPKVATVTATPEPIAPLESMNIPEITNFQSDSPSTPEPKPETPEAPAEESAPQNLNTSEIKKAALRDLVPLLDHIDIDNSQKFQIYRDIFEDLRDYTVLEPAYQAAHDISDDTERAKALLYLIESIDKM